VTTPQETRELAVAGTPRSLQGSARGREAWKKVIVDAAQAQTTAETFSIQFVDVAVQILHFCPEWGDTAGDLDNIAKPILDALVDSRRILFNDNQVKEILLRRIEWRRRGLTSIQRATPLLSEWVDKATRGEGPTEFVYVFITTTLELEALP
jgi:Holliday junction resolvase RusA-like endonuclease